MAQATNHDTVAPKEKHVQTLIKVCSQEAGGGHGPGGGFGGGRESPLSFAIASLAERMDGRGDWLVLVKSLAVLHRLMSECGHRFVKSYATAPRPAAGNGGAPGEPALSPLQALRALAAYRGSSNAVRAVSRLLSGF